MKQFFVSFFVRRQRWLEAARIASKRTANKDEIELEMS